MKRKVVLSILCLALPACSTIQKACKGAAFGVTGGALAVNYVAGQRPITETKYHMAVVSHIGASAAICAFNPVFCGMWIGYNAIVGGYELSQK